MTIMQSVVKYGFILFVGTALTVGGICGVMALFNLLLDTL